MKFVKFMLAMSIDDLSFRAVFVLDVAKHAKQDQAAVVVPDAILNRRQQKKGKTYGYEVKWRLKPIVSNVWGRRHPHLYGLPRARVKPIESNVCMEKGILINMGYLELVQREDERRAAMAGLMTKLLMQISAGAVKFVKFMLARCIDDLSFRAVFDDLWSSCRP